MANISSKMGLTLEELEGELPSLSGQLRKKILKAIVESDPNSEVQEVALDSGDESAFEELLVGAENLSFYEYFTAVDLEDLEETSEAHESHQKKSLEEREVTTSPEVGRGRPISGLDDVEPELVLLMSPEVIDAEVADDDDDDADDDNDDKEVDLQFIRKEDVVVHPLKAYTHYADLSTCDYSVEDPYSFATAKSSKEDQHQSFKERISSLPPTGCEQHNVEELSDSVSESVISHGIPNAKSGTVDPVTLSSKSGRNSLILDNDEEESLSVTTGRLSLSFTLTEAQTKDVDITSEVVTPDWIESHRPESNKLTTVVLVRDPSASKSVGKEEGSLEPQLEDESVEAISDASHQVSAERQHSPQERAKASDIVGKAIAKAMAKGASPTERRADNVIDEVEHSTSPPPTPSSEADEFEEQISDAPLAAIEMDSDDDDLLRTLDTIPEEEEISSMTESARGLSGTSSKGRVYKASPDVLLHQTPTSPDPSTNLDTEIAGNHRTTIHGPADDEAIRITSRDYEVMFSVRRSMDSLREESDAALSKISAMVEDLRTPTPDVEGPKKTPQEEAYQEVSVEGPPDFPAAGQEGVQDIPDPRIVPQPEEKERESQSEAIMVEGLKARHGKEPDYQQVKELKEQIQQMRAQLEEQIRQRPASPPPNDEAGGLPPAITLTGAPSSEGKGPAESLEQDTLSFDMTVRRLLAEGRAGTYEKAELATHLMTLDFDETDSLHAAAECSSIYSALHFLQQECELCAEKYPMRKMISMLHCTHHCCTDCAKTYFSFQIKTKNIRDLRCPFCNQPDLDTMEDTTEYYNHLDILLKSIVDKETHELFQRKLRDLTLMKDPNFRWCSKCSSGFISNPRARKVICPDCRDMTCSQCRRQWEPQHEGIDCETFGRWKDQNDPETQAQGVAKHLAECGITCPKCKFTYSLAKGGCMHFTCTQCKHEFCSGCRQPFRQGSKCPVGPYCERLGLHAHHPRNCLFYLRDKETHQLQQLLKSNDVLYDTETPAGVPAQGSGGRLVCTVQEQKERVDGFFDDICGRTVHPNNAGLCRMHYIEYLVGIIRKHNLDPVCIFDDQDLFILMLRDNLHRPKRLAGENLNVYRNRSVKLIKDQLPL